MNRQVFSKLKLLGGILLFLMGVQVSLRAQTTPQYYNGTAGTGSNAIPLGGAAYTTNKAHFLYGPGVFNSNGTTVPQLIKEILLRYILELQTALQQLPIQILQFL